MFIQLYKSKGVMSHKTVINIKLLKSISSGFYYDSAYVAEHTKIKCHLSYIIYIATDFTKGMDNN